MAKRKSTPPSAEERTENRFTTEYWPVERITPYGKNARIISAHAVDEVAKSLKAFGWRQPIVVDEAGVILVGHTRLRAALSLGFQEVPVHVAHDLSEAQKRAYRLADNKVAEHTEWDEGILREELQDLQELMGVDLSAVPGLVTGFNAAELDALTGPVASVTAPEDEPEEDPVEDAEKPASTHECPKCGHKWRVR